MSQRKVLLIKNVRSFNNEKDLRFSICFISLPFFIEEVAAAIIDEAEPNDTSVNAQLIERNNHDPAQMINGNNASQKVLVGNLSSATDED